MNETKYITTEWRQQGWAVREDQDHILELRKDGEVVARFSQTGVTIENIVTEIEAGKYNN